MRRVTAVAVGLLALATSPRPAAARDQIRIVGSSTVYPFSTAVAERWPSRALLQDAGGRSDRHRRRHEAVLRRRRRGDPDITNASRQIKESEIETCAKNGVAKITEIKIGYDGIVMANIKGGPDFDVTRAQLCLALAKEVPQDGAAGRQSLPDLERDRSRRCPAEKIEVLGPPPTSGTRDAFVELVMDKGCETLPGGQGAGRRRQEGGLPARCARTAPTSRPARTTT